MKTILASLLFVFCAFAPAQELPPDVLFDQHSLEARKAVEKGDNKRALKAFAKIEALNMELPAELLYFYAKALVEHGAEAKGLKELEKGQSLLKQFIIKAGKDSEHYEGALDLLSQAESNETAVREQAERAKAAREKTAVRRKAERERAIREERAARENPGRPFRDCAQCPEMVVVPAGSFMMGSPDSEKSREDDEGPQRRVRIGQPFAVGKYEVTFAEWDACVKAGGCGGHRPSDQDWGRGRRPVINVSWKDAQAYVKWLSRRTGKSYRLLSEAEWEYAARAGTTGPFSFGATISTSQANYDGRSTYGSGRKGLYRQRTVEVGSFPANQFGLHDMHGNVWEWVEDCWNDSYAGMPHDSRALKTGDCSRRVSRGGSWYFSPGFLRSASRNSNSTQTTGTTSAVSALPGRFNSWVFTSLPPGWGVRGAQPPCEVL